MIKQTLGEWRTEAKERFGETNNWKFVCPSCGNVQSPQDFVNAGCEPGIASNASYQECIGRRAEGQGCQWAAYGFLGTLGLGRIVIVGGDEVEVFNFAQEVTP